MGRDENFDGGQSEPRPDASTGHQAKSGEMEGQGEPPEAAAEGGPGRRTDPVKDDRTEASRAERTSRQGSDEPAPASRSVRDPEELEVHGYTLFRPPRIPSHQLSPLDSRVEVSILGETPTAYPLWNVSQCGVGFEWTNAQPPPPPGTELARLCVRFNDFAFYEGRGEVRSVYRDGDRMIVGAHLCDDLLNIDEVLHLRAVVEAWRGPGQALPMTWTASSFHVDGCYEFKGILADWRLFLEESRAQLLELERRLPWEVVHGEHEAVQAGLMGWLRQTFVGDYVEFTRKLDAAYREVSRDERAKKLVDWARRQVDSLILDAPLVDRARTKPQGYPGDYRLMMFIYRDHWQGRDLFARAVHLATAHVDSAYAVRARKDLLKARLIEALRGVQGTLRVAIVAAGPALELVEALEEVDELQGNAEIVVYDQDPSALAFAQASIEPRRRTHGRAVQCRYLHHAIRQLIEQGDVLAPYGPYDLILCAGLYDYLKYETGARLCSHLYADLKPGGELWVGNMHPSLPSRYLLEVHGEWVLRYRTHEEMLAMAQRGVPGAPARIVEESTGYNPFLVLNNPG